MERERLIQDSFANKEKSVFIFESDESFYQAMGVTVELAQPEKNGHKSLKSALLERGIRFEIRET